MATTTKTTRKPATKPVAEKPKARRKPEPQPEPVVEHVNTTVQRHEVHEAVETAFDANKPITLAKVHEQFGEFGLGRLGKMLLRGDYKIAGAAAPKKPISPNDRVARLEYIKSLLAKHGKAKIEVAKKFRRRQSA
jgi:hypothetical protein